MRILRDRHPRTTGPITVAIASIAAVAALSLAGCSGEDKPTPKGSPGATSAGSPSTSLKDESAAVLSWTPPAPVAKTEGKLAPDAAKSDIVTARATAEIISVRASDTSTILTWQLSSATDIQTQGWTLASRSTRFWPDLVRLVDPAGKKSYSVSTMEVPPFSYCACSEYPLHVGPDPVRMTAAYPALPAKATTVSVRIPNFAPVTVPISR
jgi:hypothetical protein